MSPYSRSTIPGAVTPALQRGSSIPMTRSAWSPASVVRPLATPFLLRPLFHPLLQPFGLVPLGLVPLTLTPLGLVPLRLTPLGLMPLPVAAEAGTAAMIMAPNVRAARVLVNVLLAATPAPPGPIAVAGRRFFIGHLLCQARGLIALRWSGA